MVLEVFYHIFEPNIYVFSAGRPFGGGNGKYEKAESECF